MTEERAQRRLAAILAADVVGYGFRRFKRHSSLRHKKRDLFSPSDELFLSDIAIPPSLESLARFPHEHCALDAV